MFGTINYHNHGFDSQYQTLVHNPNPGKACSLVSAPPFLPFPQRPAVLDLADPININIFVRSVGGHQASTMLSFILIQNRQ